MHPHALPARAPRMQLHALQCPNGHSFFRTHAVSARQIARQAKAHSTARKQAPHGKKGEPRCSCTVSASHFQLHVFFPVASAQVPSSRSSPASSSALRAFARTARYMCLLIGVYALLNHHTCVAFGSSHTHSFGACFNFSGAAATRSLMIYMLYVFPCFTCRLLACALAQAMVSDASSFIALLADIVFDMRLIALVTSFSHA